MGGSSLAVSLARFPRRKTLIAGKQVSCSEVAGKEVEGASVLARYRAQASGARSWKEVLLRTHSKVAPPSSLALCSSEVELEIFSGAWRSCDWEPRISVESLFPEKGVDSEGRRFGVPESAVVGAFV